MLLVLLALCQPAYGAVLPARSVRLAAGADLAAVAKLQLGTFDPQEAADRKPSFLSGLLGGTQQNNRAQRAERLTIELEERIRKGSLMSVCTQTTACQ